MSNLHRRILGLMARRNQRGLDDHDAVDPDRDTASHARRQDRAQTAALTRARLAAKHARRRYHRPDRPA